MESVDFSKINSLLDDLISGSKEHIFREFNVPMKPDYWFKSNIGIIKVGKIKDISSEGSLKLKVNIDSHAYLSYNDAKINFNTLPQFNCDISAGKKYRVKFDANCDENLNVTLYIIGYDNDKKIQHNILNVNEEIEIKFDKKCKRYRIALRFSGAGNIEIKSIKFNPIKVEIDTTDYRKIALQKREEKVELAKKLFDAYQKEEYMLGSITKTIKEKEKIDLVKGKKILKLREEKVSTSERLLDAYQKEEYLLKSINNRKK